jgi:uncharacterized membrane protein YebE (DUF533 family)
MENKSEVAALMGLLEEKERANIMLALDKARLSEHIHSLINAHYLQSPDDMEEAIDDALHYLKES